MLRYKNLKAVIHAAIPSPEDNLPAVVAWRWTRNIVRHHYNKNATEGEPDKDSAWRAFATGEDTTLAPWRALMVGYVGEDVMKAAVVAFDTMPEPEPKPESEPESEPDPNVAQA